MSEQTDEQKQHNKTDSTTIEINKPVPENNMPSDQIQPEQVEPNEEGTANESYSYGIFSKKLRYDPLSILFALLVFIGGVIGYVTADSAVSMVSGTLFALLIGAGTYLDGARKNPYLLIVVLLALSGMMSWRFYGSSKFMPSGFVALLSILMFARHIFLLFIRRKYAGAHPVI